MIRHSAFFDSGHSRGVEFHNDTAETLYITLCGIEQGFAGQDYGPSRRPGWHLHVVLSGKGYLCLDGREYDVHERQLFLLHDNAEAYYKADSEHPWHYCWITYAGSHAEDFMSQLGFTPDQPVLNCAVDVNRFLNILQNMLKNQYLASSSDLFSMGYAWQFLALAMESREKSLQTTKFTDLGPKDYVEYATRYIQNNYTHMKIADLADYIGVNRMYLATLFKKYLYVSPQEYLMQVRMNRASLLLKTTSMPVSGVGEMVGYKNALTFSKIFKKKFGLSPENYRRENGNV